jgi:hypothetical protein
LLAEDRAVQDYRQANLHCSNIRPTSPINSTSTLTPCIVTITTMITITQHLVAKAMVMGTPVRLVTTVANNGVRVARSNFHLMLQATEGELL